MPSSEFNSKQQAVSHAKELGLLSGSPTPEDQPAPKHNLPLQVTRFFGRESEISQLTARLAEHRLVTLTGSGGVGKTRLSQATAEALLSEFVDGVWLVELASLADPALVPQQVAAALGLRDQPGQPILDTLTTFLRARQALLVLDNCEHLLSACAPAGRRAAAHLPAHAPAGFQPRAAGRCRRSPVRRPVADLPRPRASAAARADVGLHGRQLVPRSRPPGAARLSVDQRNATAVARLCQRLDGIPLAIEMAAARVGVLSAEQLAQRLSDVFRC